MKASLSIFLAIMSMVSGRSIIAQDDCRTELFKCVPRFEHNGNPPNMNDTCSAVLDTLSCNDNWARSCLTNGTSHYYYRSQMANTLAQCTNPVVPPESLAVCGQSMLVDIEAMQASLTCIEQAQPSLQYVIQLGQDMTNPEVSWAVVRASMDAPELKHGVCCIMVHQNMCILPTVLRVCGQEGYDAYYEQMQSSAQNYECSEADLAKCNVV